MSGLSPKKTKRVCRNCTYWRWYETDEEWAEHCEGFGRCRYMPDSPQTHGDDWCAVYVSWRFDEYRDDIS